MAQYPPLCASRGSTSSQALVFVHPLARAHARMRVCACLCVCVCTVSSPNFNLHNSNLRVSNPRTTAYFHFTLPLASSSIPGARPILSD